MPFEGGTNVMVGLRLAALRVRDERTKARGAADCEQADTARATCTRTRGRASRYDQRVPRLAAPSDLSPGYVSKGLLMTITHRFASLSLLGTLLLGCAGDAPPARSADTESAEVPPAPPSSPTSDQDCAVTAQGKCFASAAEACAALGCVPPQCQVAYSYPAEATCH